VNVVPVENTLEVFTKADTKDGGSF
jgi:hypothetical protein